MIAAGLVVDALCEPHADEATAEAHPAVAETGTVPFFLVVRARKPNGFWGLWPPESGGYSLQNDGS